MGEGRGESTAEVLILTSFAGIHTGCTNHELPPCFKELKEIGSVSWSLPWFNC